MGMQGALGKGTFVVYIKRAGEYNHVDAYMHKWHCRECVQ